MASPRNVWPPAPIIYINAFPGTGKLTIAKHLVSLFQTGTVKLVHNHLLINPADAVLDRDQPGYQKLRRKIRRAIFKPLIKNEATYYSAFIFTDFQTDNDLGINTSLEYMTCAEERHCQFIPITLVCDEEVNRKRLVSDDRASHGKLVDVELVRNFRKNSKVVGFEGHTDGFTLDVTYLSSKEAAAKIARHLVKVSMAMRVRVKDTEIATEEDMDQDENAVLLGFTHF
ncbi:hypothetical protein LRP88_14478 [Fusarium phalaenopsidis]|nr:hypothetical protein NCS56_00361300 [Fusarium sp. Ph1]